MLLFVVVLMRSRGYIHFPSMIHHFSVFFQTVLTKIVSAYVAEGLCMNKPCRHCDP